MLEQIVKWREKIDETETEGKEITVNTTNVSEVQCTFCDGNHYPDRCFKVRSPRAKRAILQERGLCFKCMKGTHSRQQCSHGNCKRCVGEHHISICGTFGQRREDSRERRIRKIQEVVIIDIAENKAEADTEDQGKERHSREQSRGRYSREQSKESYMVGARVEKAILAEVKGRI